MSEDTRKIHVYTDSAEWAKYDRWFKMPDALLRRLYVCSYEIVDNGQDFNSYLPELSARHADCVFIF